MPRRQLIGLAGNPFGGLAATVQLQSGWAGLLLGNILVLAAAVIKNRSQAAPATRAPTNQPK